MSKIKLELPPHCKGAMIAYNSVWDEDEYEDDYVDGEEVGKDGVLIFYMDALEDVTFKFDDLDKNSFYWKNCFDCKYRNYECKSGVKVYQNGDCSKLNDNILLIETQYVTRDVPEHIWMFNGEYYYVFTPYDETHVVPLTLGNVHPGEGSFCVGDIEVDEYNDVMTMYDNFYNCTRNNDYSPIFKHPEKKYHVPQIEDTLRNWSIDKLVVIGDEIHKEYEQLSYSERNTPEWVDYWNAWKTALTDLNISFLDSRDEKILITPNDNVFISDYRLNDYSIQLAEENDGTSTYITIN